jgi:hypothetical protein
VLDAALGGSKGKLSGEHALLRSLHGRLRPGDIVLADGYYSSFDEVMALVAMGVDVVMRQVAGRPTDFRRGTRLGREDHLVTWHRHRNRAEWMSREEFAALPRRLAMRELRVRVERPGFRTRSFVVVTSLSDAGAWPRRELAGLYRRRWHAEICQADCISRYTLYRSGEASHSGRGGAIGSGPLASWTPRFEPRTTTMRNRVDLFSTPPSRMPRPALCA